MEPREVLKNPELFKKLAKEAFSEYDSNKNGEIDKEELKNALTKFAIASGVTAPDDGVINETMGELDKNKSGTLTLDEFEAYMRSTLIQMCT